MSDTDQWLTYDEAAKLLGIKPDSVRRRATARKWPRRQGNDGLARVLMPSGIIPDHPPDALPEGVPAVIPDAGLIERAARAEARADALAAQVADLRTDRDRWRELAEKLAASGNSDAGTARPSGFLERFFFKKKRDGITHD